MSPRRRWAKKYGDCKDKATLLVTMLRAAGIPAYVALLNAGARMDVPAELPGMGLFDHAIVYVPAIAAKGSQAAMPAVWIDATDRYARLGQLPICRPGKNVADRAGGDDAPGAHSAGRSAENALVEFRTLTLSENGPATVVEKTEPRGVYESRYRSYYADKPDKDTRENPSSYVKSQYVERRADERESQRSCGPGAPVRVDGGRARKPSAATRRSPARRRPFATRRCFSACRSSCRKKTTTRRKARRPAQQTGSWSSPTWST